MKVNSKQSTALPQSIAFIACLSVGLFYIMKGVKHIRAMIEEKSTVSERATAIEKPMF